MKTKFILSIVLLLNTTHFLFPNNNYNTFKDFGVEFKYPSYAQTRTFKKTNINGVKILDHQDELFIQVLPRKLDFGFRKEYAKSIAKHYFQKGYRYKGSKGKTVTLSLLDRSKKGISVQGYFLKIVLIWGQENTVVEYYSFNYQSKGYLITYTSAMNSDKHLFLTFIQSFRIF